MPVVDFENMKKHSESFAPETLEAQLAEARRNCETLRAAWDEESEQCHAAESALAEVLFALRRYDEALKLWERVTQRSMCLWGEDDELTLEAAEYLALCLDRVGRSGEALDVCDQFGLDEEILDGRE